MQIIQRRTTASEQGEDPMPSYRRGTRERGVPGSRLTVGLLILLLTIVGAAVFFPDLTELYLTARSGSVRDLTDGGEGRSLQALEQASTGSVLVSYSYFEKDEIQVCAP